MKTAALPALLLTALFTPSLQADPFSWGQNNHGQLGDRTEVNRSSPAAVFKTGALNLKKVVDVAGGEVHSMALTSDGKVYAWGYNLFGQVGDGTTTDRDQPVAVNMNGVMAGKTVTAIAAGVHQCMALTSDGRLYSWGINDGGVLGDGTTTPRNVPVAVNMSGALSGKTVTAICQGEIHCMALTTEGRVYAWGSNFHNQLGDGTSSNRHGPVAVSTSGVLAGKTVTAINDGRFHSMARTSDGRLYTWGRNAEGQLGDGTTTNRNTPVAVNMTGVLAGKTIVKMDGGFTHTVAIASDGRLYSWGANNRGQLGDGTTTNRPLPVAVDMTGALAGKTVVDVRTRGDYCLALTSDGKLYAWGRNSSGQLGDGTSTMRTSPVLISIPGRTVTAIDAGSHHSLVETIAPEIAVEQPAGTPLADGTAAISYGLVVLRSSATREFTMRNSGTDPLTVGSINVIGAQAADYTVTATLPATIPPGGTDTFSVRFTPGAAGVRNASLQIVTNDSDESPFDINLSGSGLAQPEIALHDGADTSAQELVSASPAVVQFPVTRQGSALERDFTIANTGTANLVISSIVAPAGFSTVAAPVFPVTIAPDNSFPLRLRLDAGMPGVFSGNLIINNNDADEGAFTVSISGTVITPEIAVFDGGTTEAPEVADGQQAPLDFGVTPQGTPVDRTLLVANNGTDRLLLDSLALPSGYILLNAPDLPAALEIGATVALQVRLRADAAGTFAGTAALTSDDFDEAVFDFPLTGEVFIPDPVATVPANTTALNRQTGLREQTIHIANDTTATVPAYNLIIRGLPEGVEVNNASGRREDGSWVVYVRQAMNPRSTQDILLEYFSANRAPVEIAPQVSTEVVLNPPDLSAPGDGFAIDRVLLQQGGAVLIEFPTTPGRQYQVQYSHDGTNWQASLPAIRAAANRTQWLDRGLPRTDSHPSAHASRFYRVAELAP